MATTKTIQPTGETITIPAMTDRPDMSVVASDLSKITDAVNSEDQTIGTLNSNFSRYGSLRVINVENLDSFVSQITAAPGSAPIIYAGSSAFGATLNGTSGTFVGIAKNVNGSNRIDYMSVVTGSKIVLGSVSTSGEPTVTINKTL